MKLWVLIYAWDYVCGVTDKEETAEAWENREYCTAEEFTMNDIFAGPEHAEKWVPGD